MEDAVGDEEGARVDPAGAVEIRPSTTGLLDHDRGGSGIPGRELDLDHALRRPFGDQGIAPEVAEPTLAPDVLEQRVEARHAPRRADVPGTPVEQLRVLQRRHGRHPQSSRSFPARRSDSPRATATPRVPALPERGRGDHPGLELAVLLDAQQCAEQRHATDEVVCAVDRIDVPTDPRLRRLHPVLLADQTVIRMGAKDPFADHAFDGGVGLRDQRTIGLGRDLEVASEVSKGDRVGLVGDREPQVDPCAPPLDRAHERTLAFSGS